MPKSHPLRNLPVLVNGTLASMDRKFDAVNQYNGRPAPLRKLMRTTRML
ncbi:MAG: hypothetical protein IPK27_05570 [Rhodanobacteraceae bacterium]|nr:hypothetical protein [Rhodanobacteraceae bacterium]